MRASRSNGQRPLLRVVPLLVVLLFVATGCTKMTGGGWIQSAAPASGEKATFGFVAKCETTTDALGIPTASLHGGQFQFTDHGLDLSVHGVVETLPLQTFPGMTCKDLAAADPNLLGQGMFGGTYRTQPGTTPSHEGEFSVLVADARVDILSGELRSEGICIDLSGTSQPFTYSNCGELQGGHIKVE